MYLIKDLLFHLGIDYQLHLSQFDVCLIVNLLFKRLIISNSFISRMCSIKLHYCMRRRPSTAPRGLFKLHSILKRWSRHISFIIKCLIYFSLSSDYIAWITTTPLHLDALCNDYCHWMCTKMHMIPEATK